MLSPAASFLERYRISRAVGAVLIVAAVGAGAAIVVGLISSPVTEWTTGLPELAARLKEKLHVFDDIKATTGAAMRQTALGGGGGLPGRVRLSVRRGLHRCARSLRIVGLPCRCRTFLVVAFIVVAVYAVRKHQIQRLIERRTAARARSTAQAILTDPAMVATGIQIARAIGLKRLLPILAIGGLVLGLVAGRKQMSQHAGERAPAE
jgi:predicted PurR-regulated permease PerM